MIDRRAVRPPRRIHQDDAAVVADEPRIGTRRGIARHVLPSGVGIIGFSEKLPQLPQSDHLRGRAAVAGDFSRAGRGSQRRTVAESDIDAIGRQRTGGALRPFDQRQGCFRQRRQADLLEFGGIVDAIKVGVNQRERRQVVGLRKREGRARNLQRLVAGEIADHGAGRRGLAGAEVAGQRDDVAGADQQREIGHQMRGRGLVRKCQREGRGIGHSAALRCAV